MADIEESAKCCQISPAVGTKLHSQGYHIVGSHAAVKRCSYTKAAMRPDADPQFGLCYKGTFYGIDTTRCCQCTVSISCSNACVFCWRDPSTPAYVDRWRWDVDDPAEVLQGIVSAHGHTMKELRGVAGIDVTKIKGRLAPLHVALSLIGESILYPRINSLLLLFAREGISTFVVTNGQHPQHIDALAPVTQLYLSVDAPSEQDLIRVDRPVYSDAWARLLQSLDLLAARRERTAIRITVVTDINVANLSGYATLIQRGCPDVVEVKGFSFIGSSRQRLSWENFPWLDEVVAVATQLVGLLDGHYVLAKVHERAKCVLLCKASLVQDGIPQTYINYDSALKLSSGTAEEGFQRSSLFLADPDPQTVDETYLSRMRQQVEAKRAAANKPKPKEKRTNSTDQ